MATQLTLRLTEDDARTGRAPEGGDRREDGGQGVDGRGADATLWATAFDARTRTPLNARGASWGETR